MARRKDSSDSPISLFPFLSILACVIGALVLLIAAVALSQMDTPTDDEGVARAEEYLRIEKQVRALEKERAALLSTQGEAGRLKAELDAIKKEQASLRAQGIPPAVNDALDREMAELTKHLSELEAEDARRKEALAKMQAELARRLEPPKAGQIRVQPSGSGLLSGTQPLFIETHGKGVAVISKSGRREVPTAAIKSSADLKTVWDFVKANDKTMLIFLVREDGAGSFSAISSEANRLGLVHGKLAVPGEGDLDLSLFF